MREEVSGVAHDSELVLNSYPSYSLSGKKRPPCQNPLLKTIISFINGENEAKSGKSIKVRGDHTIEDPTSSKLRYPGQRDPVPCTFDLTGLSEAGRRQAHPGLGTGCGSEAASLIAVSE